MMLTLLAAVAFLAFYQPYLIGRLEVRISEIQSSLKTLSPLATNAETQSQILQNYLDTNPIPSKLRQSMESNFREVQRKYASFDKQPNGLATKVIPESSAPYHQRHQVAVFVPENETVQIRMAVFPCELYRSRDLPPLSKAAANTILEENPFSIPGPVYLDLESGEHTILVQWFGETQTITVSIDETQRYETCYERESKVTYKNTVLGSRQRNGLHLAKADQEVINLQTICPGGGPDNDPMEHAWKCTLVRGSMLSKEQEAAQ